MWDVYADGELIFTGDGVQNGGNPPKLIDSIMLKMSQSLGADVYIDNLYVAYIMGGRSVEDGR